MADFEIVIERSASVEELEEVRAAVAAARLSANVRASLEFKSAESDMITALLVIGPLAAFLSTFASEGAKDAYRALKRFVTRAGARKGRRPAALRIEDSSEQRLGVTLPANLPEHAYRELFELDWAGLPPGSYLHYEDGAWVASSRLGSSPVPRRKVGE